MERAKIDAFFATLFWEPEAFADLATSASASASDSAASDLASSDSAASPSRPSPPPEVFRAKGVLDFAGCEEMWTLQAVHSTFEVCAAGRWDELGGGAAAEGGGAGGAASDGAVVPGGGRGGPIERRTRLVFIGRHLSRRLLADALRACRAEQQVVTCTDLTD